MPDSATILQLDQRLEDGVAVTGRAQILTPYVRQIKDRNHSLFWCNIRQCPVDDAFQPDDRALMFVRCVGTEQIQLT